MAYYIYSTEEGFRTCSDHNEAGVPHFTDLDKDRVLVSKFDTLEEAEDALKRAQDIEKSVRPIYVAAELHLATVRKWMVDLAWKEARRGSIG